MKNLNKILVPVIAIILPILSCESKEKVKRWKHCDGFSVGDAIIMKPDYATIKNDTLFINGISKALLSGLKTAILQTI